MTPMRAACYARFSSDLQRESSIEDQVNVARRYAEEHGWTVLPDHIYTDAALSGASLDRPGIRALIEAASHRPRPFDVLLVDDSSRVSRDQIDAVHLLRDLKFAGVRVVYISQHIDSANEQAELLVGVHGIVDSLYLKEMANKIKRSLAGQIDRGFATGSITYGYRTITVPNPSGRTVRGVPARLGMRVEIVPEEARVVVQIFEWYAAGLGTGRIVARLNREDHPGPRGQRWRAGAVKRLLANEKYRGKLIWGQKTFERRPGKRQKVARPVPQDQWRVKDCPELQIVSEDLWERVQARRAAVRKILPTETRRPLMRGKHAAMYSPHLFSGFMRCATCGGAITVVTGGYGSPRYGCPQSWRNGLSACTNRLTIRAKVADAHLLTRLREELAAPATFGYITDALAAALNQQIDDQPRLLAETRDARDKAHQRLQHLFAALENGVPAASLVERIAARQAELQRLDATLVELDTPRPSERLAVMPSWVRQQLDDLVGLLSDTPERTKQEFQRLSLAVTMTPTTAVDSAKAFYRATIVNALPCLAGIRELREISPSTVDRSDLQ